MIKPILIILLSILSFISYSQDSLYYESSKDTGRRVYNVNNINRPSDYDYVNYVNSDYNYTTYKQPTYLGYQHGWHDDGNYYNKGTSYNFIKSNGYFDYRLGNVYSYPYYYYPSTNGFSYHRSGMIPDQNIDLPGSAKYLSKDTNTIYLDNGRVR